MSLYWYACISTNTYLRCIIYYCLGLFSATWLVKIGPLVVEIQAEWSLWQMETKLADNVLPVVTPLEHYQVLLCYSIQELSFVLTQDLKS